MNAGGKVPYSIFGRCFTADTPIQTTNGDTLIADIRVGDTVLAYDEYADHGRGSLVEKRVVTLYNNITDEWLILSNGLTVTPGHHFLSEGGSFQPIEDILASGNGTARLVNADGVIEEVTAESIRYCAQTAHLYEEVEIANYASNGAVALKPDVVKGWKTYNFEVEELHTYVAGGIRVHNVSYDWAHDWAPDQAKIGADEFGTGDLHAITSTGRRIELYDDDVPGETNYHNGQFGSLESIADRAALAGNNLNDISAAVHAQAEALGLNLDDVATLARISSVVTSAHQEHGQAQTPPAADTSTRDNGDGFVGRVAEAISDAVSGVANAVGSVISGVANAIGSAVSAVGNAIGGLFGRNDNNSSNDSDSGKPLILDMDGDGVEISLLSDNATLFDIDGDGFLERTAWVGADDAFLAIDLAADGSQGADGKIDQGREIAFKLWDDNADTDLEGLRAAFDSNNDGVLDASDARWNEFRIWQDGNQNGVTDSGELKTLAQVGLTSLNLTSDGESVTLPDNSVVFGMTEFTKSDGSKLDVADVGLTYNVNGFREVETADGFKMEYELGDSEKYYIYEGNEDQRITVEKGIYTDPSNYMFVRDWTTTPEILFNGEYLGAITGNGDDVLAAGDPRFDRDVLLVANGGDDYLYGRLGNDTLDGGAGNDLMFGGGGHDTIFIDSQDTLDWTRVRGGYGYDTVILTENRTLTNFNIEDLEFEAIYSHNGNDKIYGGDSNNYIDGGAGNDELHGGNGDDFLFGGDGNDTLVGGNGNDVIDPGANSGSGWQYLNGGNGDDTYRYSKESGNAHINVHHENASSGTNDTLVFTDLTLADLNVRIYDYGSSHAYGSTLEFSHANGKIRVTDEGSVIERFEFADGTNLSKIEILSNGNGLWLEGTSGDDIIVGSDGDDVFRGGNGDDIIDAGKGTGTSWQYLGGGNGDDTYRYSKDSGNAFINVHHENAASGTKDTLVFTDLTLADLDVSIYDYGSGHDYGSMLEFSHADGKIRVTDEGSVIERFEFADGTSVSKLELLPNGNGLWLEGTSGDDIIVGSDGDDVFRGGNGDDIIDAGKGTGTSWQYLGGGNGDDTYRYSKDSGNALINVHHEKADTGTNDTLVFTDLTLADLDVRLVDYGANHDYGVMLEFSHANGKIRVTDEGNVIERLEFADGTILDGNWQDQIADLIAEQNVVVDDTGTNDEDTTPSEDTPDTDTVDTTDTTSSSNYNQIVASAGQEILSGTDGADAYVFAAGTSKTGAIDVVHVWENGDIIDVSALNITSSDLELRQLGDTLYKLVQISGGDFQLKVEVASGTSAADILASVVYDSSDTTTDQTDTSGTGDPDTTTDTNTDPVVEDTTEGDTSTDVVTQPSTYNAVVASVGQEMLHGTSDADAFIFGAGTSKTGAIDVVHGWDTGDIIDLSGLDINPNSLEVRTLNSSLHKLVETGGGDFQLKVEVDNGVSGDDVLAAVLFTETDFPDGYVPDYSVAG